MSFRSSIRQRVDFSIERVNQLFSRYPRTYIASLCLLALSGYAFVLVFPVLVIASFFNMYDILFGVAAVEWWHALTWFLIMLLSAQISYRMFIIRPVPAVGFTMPESKIPKVYEVVKRLQAHFKRPTIHRIIISANYELDIIKTPRWMLPVWSSNTLVIGLPLLICLTPSQFEQMVARRIGQFSKQHNMVTNWLYQLNGIWQQYSYIYSKQKNLESWFLKIFFMTYAALYKKFSVLAARKDELSADEYAMETYFHEEICEMITADALCRWYLDNRFWPAIDKAYSVKVKETQQPYRKLAAVIRGNLNTVTRPMLNNLLVDEISDPKNRYPSLHQRLDKIGHIEPVMKKYTGESAADFYLGTSLNGALNLMDKLWFKTKKKKANQKKMPKKSWLPILNNS
jgi:hypothetical protein